MKVALDFKTLLLLMYGILVIFIGLASMAAAQETENELAGILGNKYSQFSPFGFSGAFWYTKVGYSF